MMAIKRLDKADIPETEGRGKEPQQVAKYAKSLVHWFKNYRDFVVQGAWYPDEVFSDQGSSHSRKLRVDKNSLEYPKFMTLPKSMQVYNLMKSSKLFEEPYMEVKGNVCDRCDAMAHTIVDNFKIQYREEKGNPIGPSSTHMAMRFFIMSHYIADAHMPLHCDDRPLDGLHGPIEENWENQVFDSYRIDEDNRRFFYDPDGFPLATDNMSDMIKKVEENIVKRPFIYSWCGKDYSTRDYVMAVTEYSYLMAHEMVPDEILPKDSNKYTWGKYKKEEVFKRFDEYSAMLMADAIDSIARAWLHVWIRYREWGPDKLPEKKPKKGKKVKGEEAEPIPTEANVIEDAVAADEATSKRKGKAKK